MPNPMMRSLYKSADMEEDLSITWVQIECLGKSSEFLRAVAHCGKGKLGSKMTFRAQGHFIPTGPMAFWTPKYGRSF